MSAIQRCPDWRLQLDALLHARHKMPFLWGVNDCALFAADCVKVMVGCDLAAPWRGYSTARQAAIRMKVNGGLHAMATRALGAPIDPVHAAPGDVVLVQLASSRPALGLCTGKHVIGPSSIGLVAVEMACALHAWRVG